MDFVSADRLYARNPVSTALICLHHLNAPLRGREHHEKIIILMLVLAILALASSGCGRVTTRYTVAKDGTVKVEHIPSFVGYYGTQPDSDIDEIITPEGMTNEEAQMHIDAHIKKQRAKKEDEENSPFKGGGGGGGGC